jgi:hypothetical protein
MNFVRCQCLCSCSCCSVLHSLTSSCNGQLTLGVRSYFELPPSLGSMMAKPMLAHSQAAHRPALSAVHRPSIRTKHSRLVTVRASMQAGSTDFYDKLKGKMVSWPHSTSLAPHLHCLDHYQHSFTPQQLLEACGA